MADDDDAASTSRSDGGDGNASDDAFKLEVERPLSTDVRSLIVAGDGKTAFGATGATDATLSRVILILCIVRVCKVSSRSLLWPLVRARGARLLPVSGCQ